MRKKIFDHKGKQLDFSDLKKGYLKSERRFVKHHPAVEAVEEKGHWKTVAEYPNGGKDVEWVVDVPGVEAKEAWDEYEDIYRYVEYSHDEMDDRERKSTKERLIELESKMEFLIELLTNDIRKEDESNARDGTSTD